MLSEIKTAEKKITDLVLALLLTFFTTHVFAQANQQKLADLFNKVSSDQRMLFNGILIVAENGKLVYENTKGYAGLFNKKTFRLLPILVLLRYQKFLQQLQLCN
ncbi:MAG: hypothetical protein ABIN93_06700 [Ginsengibacter sp.]